VSRREEVFVLLANGRKVKGGRREQLRVKRGDDVTTVPHPGPARALAASAHVMWGTSRGVRHHKQ
jgi:hypothetical protein